MVSRFLRHAVLLIPFIAFPAERPPLTQARDLLHSLPLVFEPNEGQWSSGVRFLARASDYQLQLTGRGATLSFASGKSIDISLLHASQAREIRGVDPLPSRSSYFLGRRKENWRTGVVHYRRVRYEQVYPGIDVVYYGSGRQLEYDFVLRPGADPGRIRLQFRRATRVTLTPEGDLRVEADGAQVVQRKPSIYQQHRQISGTYTLLARNVVGLKLGSYDRTLPLTIDPVLVYSSLIGGAGSDGVVSVQVDQAGMVYVAGYTATADLVASGDAFHYSTSGGTDIFVAKFNPQKSGDSSLEYLTYIGGSGTDLPTAMILDASGNVLVTGSTDSPDFPIAGTAAQSTHSGTSTDAFVLKLKLGVQGNDAMLYSTYLGGGDTDIGRAVAVDAAGAIYVCGSTQSQDFPLTGSAYASVLYGPQDAFITKLNPFSTSSLVYSTYLGGELQDEGRAIAVAPNGTVYVAGSTESTQFPLEGNSYRNTQQGGIDVWIARMDLTKSGNASMNYSTYLGGSDLDEVRGMTLDKAGRLLLVGYTLSSDFPTTPDAFRSSFIGPVNAYIARLDLSAPKDQVVSYSTYLGGSGGDIGLGIVVDAQDNVYVTGYTLSADFPLTEAVQTLSGQGIATFVTKLSLTQPASSALLYSTYFGLTGTHAGYGIAVAGDGTIAVGGLTATQDIPLTDGAYQSGFGGGISDGFVTLITPSPSQ